MGVEKTNKGEERKTNLLVALGVATGTPEQGIDETFILYAGPSAVN